MTHTLSLQLNKNLLTELTITEQQWFDNLVCLSTLCSHEHDEFV